MPQRVAVADQHEVEVGRGADLAAGERADGGVRHTAPRHVERHGAHGLVPQLHERAHDERGARGALGGAAA